MSQIVDLAVFREMRLRAELKQAANEELRAQRRMARLERLDDLSRNLLDVALREFRLEANTGPDNALELALNNAWLAIYRVQRLADVHARLEARRLRKLARTA